ncbi:MAG: folylpolyglutamate synthase/dihydropteroate synthase, partial [Crocinitomicaceae bacterium]
MKDRRSEDLGKYLLRMQDLLDRLHNPEMGLKYIHVTGTSGKGTMTSMIH